MSRAIDIPTTDRVLTVELSAGEAVIFVGANGGGKTRLAVHLENSLGEDGHRISAHRALSINTDVPKISEESALQGIRLGNTNKSIRGGLIHRSQFRYGAAGEAVALVNDFDYLIQALFAQQANYVLNVRKEIIAGGRSADAIRNQTKFDMLCSIWERLLPHRKLDVSGDDILVSAPGSLTKYSASQMSDGERAIFYMIGQALVAADGQVLIVDEPELHMHPSIMSRLWDEIEAARPDCSFVFITHDLQFAAARAAKKYVIKAYTPDPTWEIEPVPEADGFSEEITCLILGSRRPVLFVEGGSESLDLAIYRACFPDWTVIPRSSCAEVIHSVASMRKNSALTRVTCSGVVDGDDYEDEDRDNLLGLGISVLPVAEVENLFLLPSVSSAIAAAEGYSGESLDRKMSDLAEEVFRSLDSDIKIEAVAVRYCRRRIDRILKKVDLRVAKTAQQLEHEYFSRTSALDVAAIASRRISEIKQAIAEKDLAKLMRLYDNKELLALAASHLKGCRKDGFEAWVIRSLRNRTCPGLTSALKDHLPRVEAI